MVGSFNFLCKQKYYQQISVGEDLEREIRDVFKCIIRLQRLNKYL